MKEKAEIRRSSKARQSSEESLKETLESIIIAFILAFVFRAFVVEAFVIPTGSMAPTLLGEHLRVQCEQCGYVFNSDPNDRDRSQRNINRNYVKMPFLTEMIDISCPMCQYYNLKNPGVKVNAGDRILVHKYIYNFFEPRRWDVVVFKNPEQPQVNFIKRLVGLPDEWLWVIEGNVYVKAGGVDESPWRIARKTEVMSAQLAVWQPVYHSRYIPRDQGMRADGPNWEVPWVVKSGEWKISNRRSYLVGSNERGVIEFDYDGVFSSECGQYAYNQLKNTVINPYDTIEDVRLGATFEAVGAGLSVKLKTTGRIDDTSKLYELTGMIDGDGNATIAAKHPDTKAVQELGSCEVGGFDAKVGRRVELWFVDQQLSLWVDGDRVLVKDFEIAMDVIAERHVLEQMPSTSIEVSGSEVLLHDVNVDRDLYYASPKHTLRAGGLGLGVLNKSSPTNFVGKAVFIEGDQFFCMGDNSPASSDSRYWATVDPWIEKRMLSDRKPDAAGVVPRKLMMGKAFFVYWPAAYGMSRQKIAFLPNFGDMKFIN